MKHILVCLKDSNILTMYSVYLCNVKLANPTRLKEAVSTILRELNLKVAPKKGLSSRMKTTDLIYKNADLLDLI